jgi:hypothetical protein
MIKRLSLLIILLMCFGATSPTQAIDFLSLGGTKIENGDPKITFGVATQITPSFWAITWVDGAEENDNLEGNIDAAMIFPIFWRIKGGVLAGPGIDRTPTSYYTFGYGLILGICVTEDIALWGAVKRTDNWNVSSKFVDKNTFFFGASAKL